MGSGVEREFVPTPSSGLKSLSGVKILVVDDTPDNRLLVRRSLQRAGAIVSTANDGLAAIKAASAEDFDVVVLDMHMPGMDGTHVFEALRGKGIMTPVVALTGAGGVEDRRNALQAGFADYLVKPVEPSVLAAGVAEILARNLNNACLKQRN